MSKNSEIETIFIKVLESLEEFYPKIKDESFSFYFKNEIQELHKSFIKFMLTRGRADHGLAIGNRLIFQIDNLLNIISSYENFEPVNKLIFRKTQKALLELKLAIISKKNIQTAKKEKRRGPPIIEKSMAETKEAFNKMNRNEYQLKIKELINKKGFLTSNEVYNQFPGIRKRNVRRLLSDLLNNGEIVRRIDGNSSVYSAKPQGE